MSEDAPKGTRPLSAIWRFGLGALAIGSAALAVWLYASPPTESTTTTTSQGVTTQVSQSRPDTLILGAAGAALVLGLAALSAGGVGLTFGGASVIVNDLLKQRDSAQRERDRAQNDFKVADSALGQVLKGSEAGVEASYPAVPAVEANSPADVQESASELFRQWSPPDYASLPRAFGESERAFQDRVLSALRAVPGAEIEDLRATDDGPDFLVRSGGAPRVAVEAKRFGQPSALALSAAIVEVARVRDAFGAEFGLLVLPDPSAVTGAIGQPKVSITFPDRIGADLKPLLGG